MPTFIKTLNNLLTGNLDKIGRNLELKSDFILNENNYALLHENLLEFNNLSTDTPPTGLLYNIKQLNSNEDTKNYYYTCLNLVLDSQQIQELTFIEEWLFFRSSEKSTSKLVNVNEYVIDKFFSKHNETDFESVLEIKEYTTNLVLTYLDILKEICLDDYSLYRFIPNIFSLKKDLAICY